MKSFKDYIKEDKVCFEMSNIKKNITNLPVNIWIDDAGKPRNDEMQHNEIRMKFQNNTDNYLDSDELIPVKIDENNPKILLKDGEYELGIKLRDLKSIYNFIKYWYKELIEVYEQKLDIDDFKEKLRKSGKKKY